MYRFHILHTSNYIFFNSEKTLFPAMSKSTIALDGKNDINAKRNLHPLRKNCKVAVSIVAECAVIKRENYCRALNAGHTSKKTAQKNRRYMFYSIYF